jgi:hypothetical protein
VINSLITSVKSADKELIKNSVMRKNTNMSMWNCTASKTVQTTCMAGWEAMSYRFIPTSKERNMEINNAGFNKHANFPNCVGGVDGKLIRIQKPGRSGSFYFNYKHYCSVVLLAVADSNFRFVYADAGRDSDASIFRNCSLWQNLLHR